MNGIFNFSKSGDLVFIEEGELYNWKGNIIRKPTICIDEDILIYWGDLDTVKIQYSNLLERFNESDVDVSTLKVIPLYEKLSIDDCYYVIEVANTYKDCGFIKKLGNLFETDMLLRWLSDEKAYKRV